MKNIVVLSGAGMSAESGIKTFRDAGGLWEGHDIMEVASPQGWAKNKELVLEFYNIRRRQLHDVQPNDGHKALLELEKYFNTTIVTQNVDDLHERAGSKNILHLHGELFKVRSTGDPKLIFEWKKDLNIGDSCEKGYQLRPHIVWFGESVPMISKAAEVVMSADIMIIIGTSMQVYPAASLAGYLMQGRPIYYIDPNPHISYELNQSVNLTIIEENASTGVPKVVDKLIKNH